MRVSGMSGHRRAVTRVLQPVGEADPNEVEVAYASPSALTWERSDRRPIKATGKFGPCEGAEVVENPSGRRIQDRGERCH